MNAENWESTARHGSATHDAALTAAGTVFDDVDLGRDE